MDLPEPTCRYGYPMVQLREFLGDAYLRFEALIHHQSVTLCDGQAPCAEPHGRVALERDVLGFSADRKK